MAVYPGAIKDFAPHREGEILYSAHVNDLQQEIAATQAVLGLNPAEDPTPFDETVTAWPTLAERLTQRSPYLVHEALWRTPSASVSQTLTWPTVSTTRHSQRQITGPATQITLDGGHEYTVHLRGYGAYAQSGPSEVSVWATATVRQYQVGPGALLLEAPQGTMLAQVVLPVLSIPPGPGWKKYGPPTSDAQQRWLRPASIDPALTTAVTRTERNLVGRTQTQALTGESAAVLLADLLVARSATTALSVVVDGVAPPILEITVLSLDSPTALP